MRVFGRDEKIRFRFRVNFHGGVAFIFRQLIALPPDRHLPFKQICVVRRKFVFAHTGVEKLCVQFDRHMRCQRFRSRSRQFQTLEGDATQEDDHGDVALQPGPAARRKQPGERNGDAARPAAAMR